MAQGGSLNGLLAGSPVGLRIEDWGDWLHAVGRPQVLGEALLILACGAFAWLVTTRLQRRWRQAQHMPGILLGQRDFDGALFPLLWLVATWLAHLGWRQWDPAAPLLRVALPVLLALVVVRLGVKVLQAAFPDAPSVRVLERTISWLVWGIWVLWLSGLLPVMLEEANDVRWQVGGATLTLRSVLDGAIDVGIALLLALWLSSVIEARLLGSAVGGALSLRKMLANVVRAVLIFLAVLVALTAVGIDLTTLSVFGGALGVGIGLGLQRVAANYVAGFVVLAERALRIGDVIRIDGLEGQITDIRARYTLIDDGAGAEFIVPNEFLITQRVGNLALSNRRVWQTTSVTVAHGSDARRVEQLLRATTLASPGVLREPPPTVYLSQLGSNGLEFTVGYWMDRPEDGAMPQRSRVNFAILQALREQGIEIPLPQRVIRHPPPPGPGQAGVPR